MGESTNEAVVAYQFPVGVDIEGLLAYPWDSHLVGIEVQLFGSGSLTSDLVVVVGPDAILDWATITVPSTTDSQVGGQWRVDLLHVTPISAKRAEEFFLSLSGGLAAVANIYAVVKLRFLRGALRSVGGG